MNIKQSEENNLDDFSVPSLEELKMANKGDLNNIDSG